MERLPHDRFKLLIGQIRNPGITPVSTFYNQKASDYLTELLKFWMKTEKGLPFYAESICTKKTFERYVQKFKDLILEFNAQAEKDRNIHHVKNMQKFGFFLALGPFWINQISTKKQKSTTNSG